MPTMTKTMTPTKTKLTNLIVPLSVFGLAGVFFSGVW